MGKPLQRKKKMAEMTEREARVELFKTVATFGWLSVAVFCIGGPLILCFAPGLSRCFRCTMILLSGVAGFLIILCVMFFYHRLTGIGPRPGKQPPEGD